jgi:hypothetical protein
MAWNNLIMQSLIRKRYIYHFLFFVTFILVLFDVQIPLLYARPYTTPIIDGDIGSDWENDEKILFDEKPNSTWGTNNEISSLYMTWDRDFLYIGSKFFTDNNAFLILIDCESTSIPGCSSINSLDFYPRNFLFIGMTPQIIIALWNNDLKNTGGVRKIMGPVLTSAIPTGSYSISHISGVGAGGLECSIAWNEIFKLGHQRVLPGRKLKIVGIIAGGDHSTGGDALPLNSGVTGGTISRYYEIVIDEDQDSIPDSGFTIGQDGRGRVAGTDYSGNGSKDASIEIRGLEIKPRVFINGDKSTSIVFKVFISSGIEGISTYPFQYSIRVFRDDGKLVKKLVENKSVNIVSSAASNISETWNGSDDSGKLCETGLYIIQVSGSSGLMETTTCALIRK